MGMPQLVGAFSSASVAVLQLSMRPSTFVELRSDLLSPLALAVVNRDHSIDDLPEPSRPRPGHGDLAGCFHWLDTDIRSTLERASARETCARVAAGAVCAQLLGLAGTEVLGYVRAVHAAVLPADRPGVSFGPGGTPLAQWRARRDGTRLYKLASLPLVFLLAFAKWKLCKPERPLQQRLHARRRAGPRA